MSKERIILMYHGIVNGQDPVPPGREVGADLYDVTESNFRDQLTMLREKNIKVKRIEEAGTVDVVITFDDGEANNCRTALPILKEFGYPAYFFVITRRVGRPGYMTMDELKTMVANGMVIGSHGMSHEILTNLKDTQIEEELAASRRYLERNLETEIRDFSIPRGFCNDKILRMAYAAGYKNVFISDRPRDLSDEQCHARVAVKQNWDLARFELAIKGEVPVKEAFMERTKNLTKLVLREGGYNWLRQVFIKIMK
ncbi:MAG: polysaccharide deacetylase family protein [Candidatus Omnitrophica bacterium]|nr:polysaccharide deacetylase family protein [Candidatus Omnitrophota bacterium]MCB9721578.1 polysaccharide deacetylase family protein [Candidatus Omnitrophota bacterium]